MPVLEHSASPTGSPAAAPSDSQRLRSLAHAAQHDILRRLAAPLRHDMVVPLQSLGLAAETLNARAERGALTPQDLQAAVSKLNRLSRQAITQCVEVCTWMQPAEHDSAELGAGVDEIVRLLSTSVSFRGLELRAEPATGGIDVSRSALRFLLAGAIFVLADAAHAPGAIVVRADAVPSRGTVTVTFEPQEDGSFTQPHEPGDAPLAWNELQALAAQQDVELLREDATIVLRLPRAVVTSPLAMAPV